MEQFQKGTIYDPKYSNFNLTQSAAEHLFDKYDQKCCFFKAKDINRLIFGEKYEKRVIDFKDVIVVAEDIEYLKRYYQAKNSQGKNELKERMRLLKNYYVTSDMLRYEYPMMVVNQLQQVFLKRQKQYKRLSKQESAEESQSEQQNRSEINFIKGIPEDEEYVIDLSWSGIVAGKFQEENPDDYKIRKKHTLSFEEEDYSVYDEEKQIKRKQFLKKMGIQKTSETSFTLHGSQNDEEHLLNHLILDFDDLDRHHVMSQYHKLMNKENEDRSSSSSFIGKQVKKSSNITSVFEGRKPMSSSIIIVGKESCEQKSEKKIVQKNKQSMLLGSRQQRYLQTKVMKRSSLVEYEKPKKRSFQFQEEEFIISQKSGEESPSTLLVLDKEDPQNYFIPQKQSGLVSESQFLTATFGKKQKFDMKKSDIVALRKEEDEEKWDTAKIKTDLMKFKEKPFELGYYISKLEKDVMYGSKSSAMAKYFSQKEKDQKDNDQKSTPSKTLTRVRSVQSLGQVSTNLDYTKKSKYR